MITMGSNNLHSSRHLEVLVPLLTILVIMVTVSHQVLHMVKARGVMHKMDMVDIMPLLLNLVMVRPNQIPSQGMISNKVIIQHLDTAMHPTHLGMAKHLRMELKVMLPRLHLSTLPPWVNKVTLLVSSPVRTLITLRKLPPILVMVYLKLPKLVMELSHLQVMVRVMEPLRLKSLQQVNRLMGRRSSHQVLKVVMFSLGILLNPEVMHSLILVLNVLQHLVMVGQQLSQVMVPRLMEHRQCLKLIMGSSRHLHTIVAMELVILRLRHTLLTAVQVAMHGQHMIQLQHHKESSQAELQKPRLRADECIDVGGMNSPACIWS